MKDFLVKHKNKIAIIGLIICALICVIILPNTTDGKNIADIPFDKALLRYFALIAFTTAISFIMLLIFNWQAFIYMFIMFFAVTTIGVILNVTAKHSINLTIFIISILCVALFGFRFINIYNVNKNSINGYIPRNNKQKQKFEEEKQKQEEILKEDTNLKQKIKYLDKSFIVANSFGTLFQVIKTKQGYYFHHIGGILKGIDESLLIDDFENLNIILKNKKEFIINFQDIKEINAKININNEINFGAIKIKESKNRNFSLITLVEEYELKQFWCENLQISKIKNKDQDLPISNENKQKLNKFNKILLIYSLISVFLFAIYFFYSTKYTNAILTIICCALAIFPLILYLCNQKYLEIKESNGAGLQKSNKLSVFIYFFVFSAVIMLKGMLLVYNVVVYDVVKMLLISFVIFLVIFLVSFFLSKERKKHKSVIFVLIFTLLFFCPGVVMNINFAIDFNTPQEISCQIVDKPTHTNNSGDITYYIEISYNNALHKVEVQEEFYNNYNLGDSVIVLRYSGALEIQTVILKE